MNNMTEDLAGFVCLELYIDGYWRVDTAGKINLLEEKLNYYTSMKLKSYFNFDADRKIAFDEMMILLEHAIPKKEDQEQIFFNYTNFILGVMSNLQQRELSFSIEDVDEIVEVNDNNGKIKEIIFPKSLSPSNVAISSLNILKNNIHNKEKIK